MERHFLMDISNGGVIYQVFYMLAFLTVYLILVYEGYRRKFPLLTWVLILASVQFASIIGTKLFSYSWEEWGMMIRTHSIIPNREKSLLGCAISASVIFLAVRSLFRFRHDVWDSCAVAFPVGVSLMTTGCFFYGCCYGTESHLPWAVQYPVMSLAHYHQFKSGLITYGDAFSLPVHPVQLYATLGGIAVTCVVLLFRRKWKASGNLLLFSAILFLVMRFVVDFFRDPGTNKIGGAMLGIFKEVQWAYLLSASLLTVILIIRERNFREQPVIAGGNMPSLSFQIIYLLVLVSVFASLRNWFRLPEIIAVNFALLPAVFLSGKEVVTTFAASKYKWAYASILILPVFLMSQTIPGIDTTQSKKARTYHSIGAGFATGHYQDERMTFRGSGCDMTSDYRYFNHKYTAEAIGYSFTREDPEQFKATTFGADIFFGRYSQLSLSDNVVTDINLFGISPYIRYDSKWIGIGGGFNTGNLVYTTGDTRKETSEVPPGAGYFKTVIFPRFYLRVGPRNILFADFHIADQFPASSPGLGFQTGFGTGLGLKNGFSLRYGFSFLDRGSYYISSFIPIKDRIVLEPLFLWKGGNSTSSYPGVPEKQFSVGLSYRFDKK